MIYPITEEQFCGGIMPEMGYNLLGEKIIAEPGYRLLKDGDLIGIGDRHYDVYYGWQAATDNYEAKHGHCVYYSRAGRWLMYARKIVIRRAGAPGSLGE